MKIAVGMSGGVDSSVSAAMLMDAGHDVTGVFLECWRAPGCRAEEDRKDALAVALDLGIGFEVLDFKQAYKERVVDVFFHDLSLGLTPNPDVWCNTAIKFGLFYDWAMAHGFDAIATGHYAQSIDGQLVRSADEKKDQTYFLYRTPAEVLRHVLFPIGDLEKSEVRARAAARVPRVAARPDSQGICFIGDINVHDFVKEHLGEKPGDVLDTEGNVIGRHEGVWFYTVGQRHGFELFPQVHTKRKEWKHVLPPLYVIAKNAENNTVTVGFGQETTKKEFAATDVFWRDSAAQNQKEIFVRLRHGGQLLPATIENSGENSRSATITLQTPQRGIAAGQSAVFYDGLDSKVCLGGGVIV